MTTDPPDLDLSTRRGLPAAVAHLRDRHPAARWRAHPNYGALTRFWLHVHATLRAEAAAIGALLAAAQEGGGTAADFDARFVAATNGFLGHLDAHHRIEDAQYFPRFRAADAAALAAFDVLEADHRVIHAGIADIVASARALIATPAGTGDARRFALDAHAAGFARLDRLLGRHLADEEEIVVPAMLEHGERSVA